MASSGGGMTMPVVLAELASAVDGIDPHADRILALAQWRTRRPETPVVLADT